MQRITQKNILDDLRTQEKYPNECLERTGNHMFFQHFSCEPATQRFFGRPLRLAFACRAHKTMNMDNIKNFFEPSVFMEHEVLRPLSHIRPNWELQIDSETGRYLEEEDSFAALFNALIDELASTEPPLRYHDNEDCLGEYVRKHLNWKIRKSGSTWVNQDGSRLHPSDYLALIEQGGFDNQGTRNLVLAASGRVHAAIRRGQMHFNDMERSHQVILAGVLVAILYHREPMKR